MKEKLEFRGGFAAAFVPVGLVSVLTGWGGEYEGANGEAVKKP